MNTHIFQLIHLKRLELEKWRKLPRFFCCILLKESRLYFYRHLFVTASENVLLTVSEIKNHAANGKLCQTKVQIESITEFHLNSGNWQFWN